MVIKTLCLSILMSIAISIAIKVEKIMETVTNPIETGNSKPATENEKSIFPNVSKKK